MKNILSVLVALTLSMGGTVCSASNLQNVENNQEDSTCNEKVVDHGSFVLHLNEKNKVETEENNENDSFEDTFQNEVKPSGNGVYWVRQNEDGTVESGWFEMVLDEE